MSFPNIPDISPVIKLKKREVIHLMLASIALEELSLAHIINAEGEKIQAVLAHSPSLKDLMLVNQSVERTLRNVIKQEMLLQFKLEDILDFKQKKHHEEDEYEEDAERESESDDCDE